MLRNRAVAWAFCALLCVFLLLCVVFILAEFNHDCIGDHCEVCLEIEACLVYIRGIARLLPVALAATYLGYCIGKGLRQWIRAYPAHTPITFKVKLTI